MKKFRFQNFQKIRIKRFYTYYFENVQSFEEGEREIFELSNYVKAEISI
jgi:hypothetical protein